MWPLYDTENNVGSPRGCGFGQLQLHQPSAERFRFHWPQKRVYEVPSLRTAVGLETYELGVTIITGYGLNDNF